jgi:hypothetical protein
VYAIETIENIVYGEAVDFAGVQRSLELDLSVPVNDTIPMCGRPLLVMIHGGAWIAGDKNQGYPIRIREDSKQRLSQAYCSALPVAYSQVGADLWEAFARLILEATYEATFCAALINHEISGNNKLFLTLVGGGAFGNKTAWITDALQKTIQLFSQTPLDVRIVSYGRSNPGIKSLIN